MQAGRRYSLLQLIRWEKEPLLIFLLFDSIPVALYHFFGWEWLHIPWQPISLIGIAVAFYLGFKNNSSYERLWEARKIWGGIVNASRSFTVMARDFVFDDSKPTVEEPELSKNLIYRHIAWLYALSFEMRKLKKWEHNGKAERALRKALGTVYSESKFEILKKYISTEEYDYVMSKGNRSSHLLSLQSKTLTALRKADKLEHFRHLEMQALITELYALQGKSERIKNFPFPRQYATVNYYFVLLFVLLLPFGMLDVFAALGSGLWVWFSVVFSVLGSWVFWTMEMIGDYSENPFEGTYNDVPISSMVVGIEIDIRQMLDETDLPQPIKPHGPMDILL
ncbi:bestrophin family ion channel [uncultured Arcticibacterium sp.]|uniref:bestrophin family protein n=1 Tax=uncultured Arcticibacterium sp. TaxID=2173042 RepID=UPI0030FA5400